MGWEEHKVPGFNISSQLSTNNGLHMQEQIENIHTHTHPHTHLPLVVGDFRLSSGDIRLVMSHHDSPFSFPVFLTPYTGFWRKMIFKRNQKSTESAPRIFSPLFVWIVAHFSVMGNKMWFRACWRTWMFPVQDLEAWVWHPTFDFGSLIWIIDGFSEASFHLPLNLIYHWHGIAPKFIVDLKDLSCFLENLAGRW